MKGFMGKVKNGLLKYLERHELSEPPIDVKFDDVMRENFEEEKWKKLN